MRIVFSDPFNPKTDEIYIVCPQHCCEGPVKGQTCEIEFGQGKMDVGVTSGYCTIPCFRGPKQRVPLGLTLVQEDSIGQTRVHGDNHTAPQQLRVINTRCSTLCRTRRPPRCLKLVPRVLMSAIKHIARILKMDKSLKILYSASLLSRPRLRALLLD